MRLSRRHLLALPLVSPLFPRHEFIVPELLGTRGADALVPPGFDLVPVAARDDDERYGIIVDFADLELELEHTGVVRPKSLDEDDPDRGSFLRALLPISAAGSTVIQFALAEGWRELHGFDIRDIDQIIQYGQPPDRVTILQGRFDLDEIRAALTDQGYESLDVHGVEVMNGGEDYDLNLEPETISQFWVGQAQNVALIDDETLVFAAATGLVEAVVRVRSGDDESLLADHRLTALFPGAAGPLTSAIVMDGRGLSAERFMTGDDFSDASVPLLPRVEAAVFGSTPGGLAIGSDEPSGSSLGYDIGEAQIRVLFADAEAAAEGRVAIRTRVANGSSFATGQAWSDLFGDMEIDQVAGGSLVIVHFPDWVPGQRSVSNLVYQDDFGFLLWE